MLLPFKSGRRSKISASSAVATVAFGVPLLRPPTSRIGEPWQCVRHQSRASTRVLNVTGSMSGPVTSKRSSRMRRRVRMVTAPTPAPATADAETHLALWTWGGGVAWRGKLLVEKPGVQSESVWIRLRRGCAVPPNLQQGVPFINQWRASSCAPDPLRWGRTHHALLPAERLHCLWRKSVHDPQGNQKRPHFRNQGRAGPWVLEPVEVHRVYPLVAVAGANLLRCPTAHSPDAATDALVAELRDQLGEMRAQRDAWQGISERLALEHAQPKAGKPAETAPFSLWRWLRTTR